MRLGEEVVVEFPHNLGQRNYAHFIADCFINVLISACRVELPKIWPVRDLHPLVKVTVTVAAPGIDRLEDLVRELGGSIAA